MAPCPSQPMPCPIKHTACHHDVCLCLAKAPSSSKAVEGAKNKEEKKNEEEKKSKDNDKDNEGEKNKDGVVTPTPKAKAKPKARPKAEPKVHSKEEQVLMATKKCLRMAWDPRVHKRILREQVKSQWLAF